MMLMRPNVRAKLTRYGSRRLAAPGASGIMPSAAKRRPPTRAAQLERLSVLPPAMAPQVIACDALQLTVDLGQQERQILVYRVMGRCRVRWPLRHVGAFARRCAREPGAPKWVRPVGHRSRVQVARVQQPPVQGAQGRATT